MEDKKDAKVLKIMIKCPKTGKEIHTGMSASKQTFETSTFTNDSVSCPDCGGMHTWSKVDAFLK